MDADLTIANFRLDILTHIANKFDTRPIWPGICYPRDEAFPAHQMIYLPVLASCPRRVPPALDRGTPCSAIYARRAKVQPPPPLAEVTRGHQMPDQNLRWTQKFNSFPSALLQLQAAVKLAQSRELSALEKQGLIQAFEFTHELAWNVLKDYFEYLGTTGITGSRDATREAFQIRLAGDG